MHSTTQPTSDVAIFKADGSFALEVRLDSDTVWLSLQQIADLFGRDRSVVSRHLSNIYRTKELRHASTVAKHATVQSEGGRTVSRNIEHYNLDAILSVGYRINSKRGTQFRIWANTVLRDHLLKGYTLNTQRLEARGVADLQSAIELLGNTLSTQGLVTDEGRAVLDIVQRYARSWKLLLAYDEGTLTQPPPTTTRAAKFSVAQARKAISAMKRQLLETAEATDLFGLERGQQLDAILEGLNQTFGGKALYPTVETRAAHLLYFVIKDHPFADGNKRIGSFLFVNYLARHKRHHRITDMALVALALLTAQSEPRQKDQIIRLIMNLLA